MGGESAERGNNEPEADDSGTRLKLIDSVQRKKIEDGRREAFGGVDLLFNSPETERAVLALVLGLGLLSWGQQLTHSPACCDYIVPTLCAVG